MGPFLEDATTIGFARLLAQEIGGFQAPKGYSSPADRTTAGASAS